MYTHTQIYFFFFVFSPLDTLFKSLILRFTLQNRGMVVAFEKKREIEKEKKENHSFLLRLYFFVEPMI